MNRSKLEKLHGMQVHGLKEMNFIISNEALAFFFKFTASDTKSASTSTQNRISSRLSIYFDCDLSYDK